MLVIIKYYSYNEYNIYMINKNYKTLILKNFIFTIYI